MIHTYKTDLIRVDKFFVEPRGTHYIINIYDINGKPMPQCSGTIGDEYRYIDMSTKDMPLTIIPLY